jgi:hypothetical protein
MRLKISAVNSVNSAKQLIRQEGSQNNRAAVVRIHGDVMAAKISAGQRSKIRAVRPTSCVILMSLLFVTFASKVGRRFQRGDSPKQSRFLRTLSASSKVSPGAMINFARNSVNRNSVNRNEPLALLSEWHSTLHFNHKVALRSYALDNLSSAQIVQRRAQLLQMNLFRFVFHEG